MKHDWIWMPHAGHLCVSRWCRFHLNTYVNGYIVSTVGEYWPEEPVRRINVECRGKYPKFAVDEDGKVHQVKEISDEQRAEVLSLKGDAFDAAYMAIYGFETVGCDRKYETMVFKAKEEKTYPCCPYVAGDWDDIDFDGYNDPVDAYKGHLNMCEKWDKEVHGSEYKDMDEDS